MVLHITTHMGGGIGRALSELVIADAQNENTIIILQNPEKTHFIDKCKRESNVKVFIGLDTVQTSEIIQNADVIIIHWWHHPMMYQFLHDLPDIPSRIILWSHVSGCSYPYLNPEFIRLFDYLIYTSKYTLENKYWNQAEREWIDSHSSLVYGQGSLKDMNPKSSYDNKSETIQIGYVGTLAESKLHPCFPEMCRDVIEQVSNVRFIMIGDNQNTEWLQCRLQDLGISDYVTFTGYTDDVNKALTDLDILGYPLNPYNFATTENSILEAMAVGLPVVLMRQGTEKYIIDHGIDGLLANDISDYVKCIVELIKNQQLREKLGRQARINVYQKYDYKTNLDRYYHALKRVFATQKSVKDFSEVIGNCPLEWFMSAVNSDDKEKIEKEDVADIPAIFKEESKGSIRHFAREYPTDEHLQMLREKIV